MSKKSKINLYQDAPLQTQLFSSAGKRDFFPPVFRDEENFNRILREARGYLGVDFEFPTDGPSRHVATIVGIATRDECAAIGATRENVGRVFEHCRANGIRPIGHSVFGAEIPVFKTMTGQELSVRNWRDSMLSHYLVNQDFAKAPDKSEQDEGGALGFMNLWTTASMVLEVPNWKQCRGEDCTGHVCPEHDVRGYCAVDAWASIAAFLEHEKQFAAWNIPWSAYESLTDCTVIAEKMQARGVKVDMEWVNLLESKADEIKEKLFPYEGSGKDRVYQLFNPRSSDQILKYFNSQGVDLKGTDKKSIRVALEKAANKYGFSLKDEEGRFSVASLENAEELNPVLDSLFKTYQYKAGGKGLAPWFDKKYRDADDFLHPRWITIGASTTRFSSSRPNFQNIPARGFGSLVRAAVIPRDPSLQLVKSDESQLELRMCLYLAGLDPSTIGKDAFTWLVSKSGGKFTEAASRYSMTERDIAKSVSHAGSYLESFSLLSGNDLQKPYNKNLIERGALKVYLKKYGAPFDWHYHGKVVGFTGANLAERLFGDKSFANRKKALEIQEIYFGQFPMLREWQKKTLDFVQENHYVRYPTGHVLQLYSTPEENAKMACAALGQGVSAQYMQGLLKIIAERKIPLLFVHDEFVLEIPRDWSDKRVAEEMTFMGAEIPALPGFRGSYKVLRGDTWLEGTKDTPEDLKPKCLWPLDI